MNTLSPTLARGTNHLEDLEREALEATIKTTPTLPERGDEGDEHGAEICRAPCLSIHTSTQANMPTCRITRRLTNKTRALACKCHYTCSWQKRYQEKFTKIRQSLARGRSACLHQAHVRTDFIKWVPSPRSLPLPGQSVMLCTRPQQPCRAFHTKTAVCPLWAHARYLCSG